MRTEILAAAGIIAAAIIGVRAIDARQAAAVDAGEAGPELTLASAQSAPVGWGDEVRISASIDRQYYVNAEINRRSARFLVDTGASYVALRDSDARAAGIYTSYAYYK
jgi:aspartyl protease family protein